MKRNWKAYARLCDAACSPFFIFLRLVGQDPFGRFVSKAVNRGENFRLTHISREWAASVILDHALTAKPRNNRFADAPLLAE